MSTEYHGVKATVTYTGTGVLDPFQGESNPLGSQRWEHNAWDVVLRTEGRQMTVPYYTGLGITGEPTAEDIVDSLVSDARTIDSASGFEDWAYDMGADTDSRAAERIYNSASKQTARLRKFLGDRFDEFLDLDF